jgi:hypothetical protein
MRDRSCPIGHIAPKQPCKGGLEYRRQCDKKDAAKIGVAARDNTLAPHIRHCVVGPNQIFRSHHYTGRAWDWSRRLRAYHSRREDAEYQKHEGAADRTHHHRSKIAGWNRDARDDRQDSRAIGRRAQQMGLSVDFSASSVENALQAAPAGKAPCQISQKIPFTPSPSPIFLP